MVGISRFFALLCVAGAASADGFDGVYRQVGNADCNLVGVDGGALEIKDGIFHGVENECRMTKPVPINNMDGSLYTMVCSSEEELWTERAMLLRTADDKGIYMIWDGYVFQYEKCPETGQPTGVPTAAMRPQARPIVVEKVNPTAETVEVEAEDGLYAVVVAEPEADDLRPQTRPDAIEQAATGTAEDVEAATEEAAVDVAEDVADALEENASATPEEIPLYVIDPRASEEGSEEGQAVIVEIDAGNVSPDLQKIIEELEAPAEAPAPDPDATEETDAAEAETPAPVAEATADQPRPIARAE